MNFEVLDLLQFILRSLFVIRYSVFLILMTLGASIRHIKSG